MSIDVAKLLILIKILWHSKSISWPKLVTKHNNTQAISTHMIKVIIEF